jgi:hypothetical protein
LTGKLARGVAIFLGGLYLFANGGGSALADVAISAAPSLFEVAATPGGVGSQEIRVTNAGTEPFRVSAQVAQYKGAEGSLSALNWLKVEPASFDLAPGEQRTVKVSITIPQDAGSGGRYALVAFKTGSSFGDGSAVGVAAQVGVPFLITVKGVEPLTQQPSFDRLVPVLEPNGGLGFRAAVENRGNTHFYSRGTVEVTSEGGQSWGRAELRESTAILPGTLELLYSDRPISFREGTTYRAKGTISFGEGSPQGHELEFRASSILEIDEVSAQTGASGELDVFLRLRNTGGLGLLPRIVMAVREEQGKVAGVLAPNQQPLVWPGQSVEVQAEYPGRLSPGTYTLVARAEFGAAAAQREIQFEIAKSTTQAGSSVPVSMWAAPIPVSPQLAPDQPQQPSPAQPTSYQVPEATGHFAGSITTFLLLLVMALAGALLLAINARRPPPGAKRRRTPLALPSPRRIGFLIGERLGRHQRPHPAYRPVELLPPPPLHLLPPPMRTESAAGHASQGGSAPGTSSQGESSGARLNTRMSGFDIAWLSSEMAWTLDPAARPIMPTNRRKTRLASALAEKAEELVNEARNAAQLGDRLAVDRLSRHALRLDPRNVDAWLWLAASCEEARSARMCLEAVQILDPANVKAKRALAGLDGGSTGDGRPDGRWEATGPGRGGSPATSSRPAS